VINSPEIRAKPRKKPLYPVGNNASSPNPNVSPFVAFSFSPGKS
jgi:hypothetical protein